MSDGSPVAQIEVFPEINDARNCSNVRYFDSLYTFRSMVRVFALVGMRMEVYPVLRDIFCYTREAGQDLFALFSFLIDSNDDVEKSRIVFDMFIRVFFGNLMLENAVSVFIQAKKMGIKPIFLFKCLAEANRFCKKFV